MNTDLHKGESREGRNAVIQLGKKSQSKLNQTTAIGQSTLVGDAIQLGKKSLLKLDQMTSIGQSTLVGDAV
jgi:UDP-3-O-[3-hydroxymyristoyl] glucosamine N-acyltransferase